jgi:hypothetical protein
LIGGAVLLSLGERREIYLGIFVASGLLRLATFVFLRPRFATSPRDGYHRPMRPTHSIDIAASVPHGPPPSAGGTNAPAGGLTVPVTVKEKQQ